MFPCVELTKPITQCAVRPFPQMLTRNTSDTVNKGHIMMKMTAHTFEGRTVPDSSVGIVVRTT